MHTNNLTTSHITYHLAFNPLAPHGLARLASSYIKLDTVNLAVQIQLFGTLDQLLQSDWYRA
jgi:hypothetical protein